MRIIIVEDELDTLEELRDYVHEYDEKIEIEVCSNPLLAIKTFQTNSYDAALLDIQMPEMTGLELADCLSALSPTISFVFITAYNNYAAEAFEINAVDYILKPLRQERLNKALDKIRKEVEEKEKSERIAFTSLSIQAFGKMVVSSGDNILKWKRQKSAEIFAYLLHQHGTPVHKEKLCEMMWPDYDPQKSLTYLQTIMYQLRKNISEIGDHNVFIDYADHCYRLTINMVRYDVDLFAKAFDQSFAQSPPSIDSLIEAEQLYTGPYFEEEGWIWALGRQQDLAGKYLKILESMIRMEIARENKQDALLYIKKWAGLGVYQNQDYYLEWVEKNIGSGEAKILAGMFTEDI